MKFISDNLLTFALAVVLGLSPIQSITASVSKCINMDQSMQHHMNVASTAMQNDMAQSGDKDCCEQTTCDMSHCASGMAVVTVLDIQDDVTYIVSNIDLKPSVSLIQFYPSSLYRPPKV